MAYRYAISDPHGCLDVLEQALSAVDLSGGDHLYLLGDYIPHPESCADEGEYVRRCNESLQYVRSYCRSHMGSVTALMGNHEYDLLDSVRFAGRELDPFALRFLHGLKLYAETDRQIFVHAGVNERARDWRNETSEIEFLDRPSKPAGRFEKDIVAGHRSAARLSGKPGFRGVFWDGLSHYVIDGATEKTGVIPLLRYNVEEGVYEQLVVTVSGAGNYQPVEPSGRA